MEQAQPAQMGHNLPPNPLDPEEILRGLGEKHDQILARTNELQDSCNKMPAEVESEAMAAKFTDQGSLVNTCRKEAEAARVAETAPFLAGQRQISAHFRAPIATLDELKKAISGKLTRFQIRKEAEERARLEAERKEAEEIAKKAEEEAEDEAGLVEAVIADEEANAAKKAAEADAAELSRSRGQYGGVSSLRKVWTFTIKDKSAIPLERLRPYLSDEALEKAIRGLIRAEVTPKGEAVELPGVKIFQQAKSAIT